MLTVDNGMGMDEQAAEQGRSSGGSDAPQGLQWGAGPGPAPVSPQKKKTLSGAKAAKEAQVSIAAGFSLDTCKLHPVGQPKAECHSGSMMQCCQSACLSCLMHAFMNSWQQQLCLCAAAHSAYNKRTMHLFSAQCMP